MPLRDELGAGRPSAAVVELDREQCVGDGELSSVPEGVDHVSHRRDRRGFDVTRVHESLRGSAVPKGFSHTVNEGLGSIPVLR
jgi:hypothetical protein